MILQACPRHFATAAFAASRATVRMVPSTGFVTDSSAARDACSMPRANSAGPQCANFRQTFAHPPQDLRKNHPGVAPCTRAERREPGRGRPRQRWAPPGAIACSTAARSVSTMLVPVSPSGHGKDIEPVNACGVCLEPFQTRRHGRAETQFRKRRRVARYRPASCWSRCRITELPTSRASLLRAILGTP